MIFIIIYIYLNLYLCIYTPSYPHFKAFPVLKFNSETSFLCQLFKENSNIIVLKPGKLINEAIFWFSLLFIFIHIFIDAYTVLLISPGTFGKTAILIFWCGTHSCHWMSKQISQGFRACLKVKKIKKTVFGNSARKAANLQQHCQKWNFLLWTMAVTSVIS